jgi:hypothetical protein
MPLRRTDHGSRKGRAGALLLVLACQLPSLQVSAQKPSEYEVKAVYLDQFGKFVRWPAESHAASEAFTICVLGEDPFGEILERVLEGETFDGKRPAVRRIRRVEAAAECRMVFISASERDSLMEILEGLRQRSILTVSDIGDFSRRGGMIQLVLDSGRVRFEVNLEAAAGAGLELSSELLKVARAVRRGSHGPRSSPPPRGS